MLSSVAGTPMPCGVYSFSVIDCVGCGHPMSEHDGKLGCMVSTDDEAFCACPIRGDKVSVPMQPGESDYEPTAPTAPDEVEGLSTYEVEKLVEACSVPNFPAVDRLWREITRLRSKVQRITEERDWGIKRMAWYASESDKRQEAERERLAGLREKVARLPQDVLRKAVIVPLATVLALLDRAIAKAQEGKL